MSRPKVSIVIVNYRTSGLTLSCLKSVDRVTSVPCEVVVVDNHSEDESLAVLRKWQRGGRGRILVENKENLGFAGGNNLGIARASGEFVLLLNSDTRLREDAISYMVEFMDENLEVGVAGCKLVNRDGSLQATGGYFPSLGRVAAWTFFFDDLPLVGKLVGSYHPHVPGGWRGDDFFGRRREVDWVTGAFFLVRKKVIDKVGGLDEEFFMYVEEVDFCYRVKNKGWKVWYVPEVEVVHLGGGSSQGSENQVRGEFRGLRLFYKKHYEAWERGILAVLLKITAFLRWLVLGVVLGRGEARKVYAKALASF